MKINDIDNKNILVVGDVMLDTYFKGEVGRISPEAPVPVFLKKDEKCVPGGAANVAVNLVAAGQNVALMSVIGSDLAGESLQAKLIDCGVNCDCVLKIERNTTEKTRFIASNNQQVMRLDVEDSSPIKNDVEDKLLDILDKKISHVDLIVISDYMKGLLTERFTQAVIEKSNRYGIKVLIDVKDRNWSKYRGAYLIKPNLNELKMLTGNSVNSDEEILSAAQKLRKVCNSTYILVTCGARGMTLIGEQIKYHVDSVGKEVFDVTGAGDTTISYLSACIANEMDICNSVKVSNYAAGIQVGKVGTSIVTLEEVRNVLIQKEKSGTNKIVSINNVSKLRDSFGNKKVVFTNGCFDILHVGHIRYLEEASKLGDVLVVGLNSDESVRRLKGPDRPINTERERGEVLCALRSVDYVIVFEEDTPYELIRSFEPDVLVKGGDYAIDQIVGRDIVENKGGKVVVLPFVEGKSTTNIITKIRH